MALAFVRAPLASTDICSLSRSLSLSFTKVIIYGSSFVRPAGRPVRWRGGDSPGRAGPKSCRCRDGRDGCLVNWNWMHNSIQKWDYNASPTHVAAACSDAALPYSVTQSC